MRKYLLFSAHEYNWSMIAPGDWTAITWRIYSDSTYKIIVNIQKSFEEAEESITKGKRVYDKVKSQSGTMDCNMFKRLNELTSIDYWRKTSLPIKVCDGSAWSMRLYSSEGTIVNSSGPIYYIDGEEILEEIVSCLPEPEGRLFARE